MACLPEEELAKAPGVSCCPQRHVLGREYGEGAAVILSPGAVAASVEICGRHMRASEDPKVVS